jgi:hypothetical protein
MYDTLPSRFATLDRGPLVLGLRVKAGNELDFGITVNEKPDGEPAFVADLTGYEFDAFVSRQADDFALAEFAIDASDAAAGTLRLTLTPEQTASLTPGTYRHRLTWQPPDARFRPRTIVEGALEVSRK